MVTSWHKFKCLGLLLAYDVASGSLHLLDDVGWSVLDSMESGAGANPEAAVDSLSGQYPPELIREVFHELAELFELGQLGAADPGLDFRPELPKERPVKALCLHMAHACNLTCGYCFASSGTFGGVRELMTAEVAQSAIDMLMRLSLGRKHCEIDFFGGEPLLNWDVVKAAVAHGERRAAEEGKVLKFTLTTNGISLTSEVMDFLDAHNIAVVLSLDGRKPVNDRMRCFIGSGDASVYDAIVPGFQALARRRNQQGYYVRGTYTAYNRDFSADVRHLAGDLGFRQVSVEPVIAGPDDPYALKPEHLPELLSEYERLATWLLEQRKAGEPVNFFHFNIDLERGPCLAKRVSGCGAGNEYLAVTPTGDLFPCHQFVGHEEFRLGTVWTGVTEPALRDSFSACNLVSKPTCRDCWARYFCGGGCHANAQFMSGDLGTPYEFGCALQRKRVECALAMQAALATE